MTIDSILKGSAIGAILASVVAFWGQIKEFLWKIISLVIQRIEITTEEGHDAIIAYLVTHYPYFSIYDKSFGAINETMRDGRYGLVPFEKYGANTMIFRNSKRKIGLGFPFLFSAKKEKSTTADASQSLLDSNKVFSTITFVRGTVDINNIIAEAAKMRNKLSWQQDDADQNTSRFDIFYLPNSESDQHAYFSKTGQGFPWYRQNQFRLLAYKPEHIGRAMTSNGNALNNLFFPQKVKELIGEIALWVKSKDWYKQKNIPWKRGWLLYGPPGTGKTALARAFAEDLNMPIYVYALSQMTNNDLIKAWRNMQLNIPCIALIEDIDNVFHGRKNVSGSMNMMRNFMGAASNSENGENKDGMMMTPLTFDCLLNCIDGVDKADGVFTVITTNDISKIDKAIGQPVTHEDGRIEFVSSRPGRIDKAIELSYMETENKLEMADKILSSFPAQLEEVKKHIALNIPETPAQFQEYCAQIAIKAFWNKNEDE